MSRAIGRRLVLAVIVGSALLTASSADAQPVEIPATFGGDFWSRPRLTGDWFGLRDEMGKRGVTLVPSLSRRTARRAGRASRTRSGSAPSARARRTAGALAVDINEGRGDLCRR
jgi:hypothetical protein